MNKILKITGLIILILIVFRGFIYRQIVNYTEIGLRDEIEITNRELIRKIEAKSKNRNIDLEIIAEIAEKITSEELNFTMNRTSNNPNVMIDTNQANCVGYSVMFNSISNYLIRMNKLQNQFEAKHKIGELDLLGINLHQFFESPFFRDHDFNDLTDKETGKIISVDPSLSDYFQIKRISKGK